MIKYQQASALIMEDDADWDVDFRTQLEHVALGAQTLLDTPKNSEPASPYGDGWDLIWLGHCASQPLPDDDRRVLMKNDRSVTPFTHRVNFGDIPDMSPYDNTTRLMYFSKGSTCTYSYALSLHGAQKVLKWLSMDVYNQPVDFGLADMCSDKKRGFKCIGVFPQIIADHKPAGGAIKDSDIGFGDPKGSEGSRQKGFSYNIVRSTRLNVDALIDGKREQAESQWPEEWQDLKGELRWSFGRKRSRSRRSRWRIPPRKRMRKRCRLRNSRSDLAADVVVSRFLGFGVRCWTGFWCFEEVAYMGYGFVGYIWVGCLLTPIAAAVSDSPI